MWARALWEFSPLLLSPKKVWRGRIQKNNYNMLFPISLSFCNRNEKVLHLQGYSRTTYSGIWNLWQREEVVPFCTGDHTQSSSCFLLTLVLTRPCLFPWKSMYRALIHSCAGFMSWCPSSTLDRFVETEYSPVLWLVQTRIAWQTLYKVDIWL